MDKKTSNCILCKSDKLRLEQRLNTNDLKVLYNKRIGIDISNELNNHEYLNYYKCNPCGLYFFDPDFAGSEVFYEDLQNHRKVYYNPNRAEFEYVKTKINEKDSVLEIGSGSGFFAEKLKTSKYLGLEYNDKAIEEAAKKGIKLLKKSIESFSKSTEETFDVVCSFHVLEHVTDPYAFIKASVDILNKNGQLIIAVPFNESKLTNNINHVLNLPPHHITRWDLYTLRQIAVIFNLKLEEYKIHTITKRISKYDYFKTSFLNASLRLLYPSKKVLMKPVIHDKIQNYVSLIVKKLKLYHLQKEKNIIGENITVIFKKK